MSAPVSVAEDSCVIIHMTTLHYYLKEALLNIIENRDRILHFLFFYLLAL